MTVPATRYHGAAIILHWVMAVAFILMLASGLSLEYVDFEPHFETADAAKQFKYQLFQWHKSLGVLLLIAVALRIAVRLWQKPPALPAAFKRWEAVAATLGHLGLYAAMIVMPLSGWLMVSSSPFGLPTMVFNLFEWPHFPGVAANESVNGAMKFIHWIGAWAFLALLAAHIGAVIKHYLFDHENLLRRMWWSKR